MYSFAFKLKKQEKNWKIIVNGHEIPCSKTVAESISNKILKNNNNNNNSGQESKGQSTASNFFEISIPELENSLIFSETDYQYFYDILNLVPIQISVVNKDFLKIFARELEIEQLSESIELFEQAYEQITTNKFLQLQKDITNEILDISEDNYEQIIEHLAEIYENEEESNIINNDFLYNIVLTTCMTRSRQIELLMKFLKELETKTKRNQYKYFINLIVQELKDNSESNEIRFIVRYLYSQKEISEETINSTLKNKSSFTTASFKDIIFDKLNQNIKSEGYMSLIGNELDVEQFESFTKEFLDEYAKKGGYPTKVYQSIVNDDLEAFTELMNESASQDKYNNEITTIIYERNTDLYGKSVTNLDLAAFYGSEKIFNLILLNSKLTEIDDITLIYSISGGNSEIIHKCTEVVQISELLLYDCLYRSIKYNRNEIFEWLTETYEPFKNNFKICEAKKPYDYKGPSRNIFLELAIQYNNFNALFYLLSLGIDYQPLFSLAMIYNNFYLASCALKLPYNCNSSSNIVQKKKNSPFQYEHYEISLFFNLKCPFLLPSIRINLILLKLLLTRRILSLIKNTRMQHLFNLQL